MVNKYMFSLILLVFIPGVCAESDILSTKKRNPASQEAPKLEGTRVLMTNRTYDANVYCVNRQKYFLGKVEGISCVDGLEHNLDAFSRTNELILVGTLTKKNYAEFARGRGAAVEAQCASYIGRETSPPVSLHVEDLTKENCYAEVVELKSIEDYVNYKVNAKVEHYLNLIDAKVKENIFQAVRNPDFQNFMQQEARRALSVQSQSQSK